MTSPSIRTFQMKANDLNYMPVHFRGHSITGLGIRGHSFHPNMTSKKLKSQKNLPNPKVELRMVPLNKSFLIKMPNSSFKMAFMKTIFQQIVYLLINKIYFLLIC